MAYIDPHIHMVSRTTDDYQRMAQAGCVAITEPAFWAGFDRSSAQGFFDYFRQLTDTEPERAANYGIKHHCWLCINPKEAEDVGFARSSSPKCEAKKSHSSLLRCNRQPGSGSMSMCIHLLDCCSISSSASTHRFNNRAQSLFENVSSFQPSGSVEIPDSFCRVTQESICARRTVY